MIKGFWSELKKPIVAMSPMDGVTDAPWRFIAKKYGEPDVVYTEFVSAEGLFRINKRGEMGNKIWKDLKFTESERPVVAQLFGSDPEAFYESAKIICKLGFDGLDINMGCPSPGLEKRGGGAGLIRVPDLARKVIEETRRGVRDWSDENGKPEIPVSIKTRIGSSEPDRSWWEFLAGMELPCVSMHGRSFKQLYSGESDWESLREAASIIRNEKTLFLANGDIRGMEDYRKVVLVNGKVVDIEDFDGILIGRAAMGNPWAFRKSLYTPTTREKLSVAIEHSKKYEEMNDQEKFFAMRKHLAWYAHGFENATDFRRELVMTNSASEVQGVVEKLYSKLPSEHK